MKFLTTLIVLMLPAGISFAGGDPVAGKRKVALCMGCHGADGNGTSTQFPKLAGQGEEYLAKQIRDFKSGERKEEHMTPMAETINVSDIGDISAYYSSLTRSIETNNNKVGKGKSIFLSGIKSKNIAACASCHGEKGQGNTAAKFPALSGQYSEYLAKSIKDFRSGERNNDTNNIMRNIAVKLSDKEITSLSNYLSTLK